MKAQAGHLHRYTNHRDGSQACVYFLLRRGVIVYIGKATKLSGRIREHQINGKRFDRCVYFYADPTEYALLEAAFIWHLRPKLNVHRPRMNRRAMERALACIGLTLAEAA